jgi:thioesterase domain-containing protein
VLVPLGEVAPETIAAALAPLEPTGWTPIAAALEQAATAFEGREGQVNRIVMVSDGVETCGGDPVAVARRLHEEGLAVTIDIVGLDIETEADSGALRRIAEVTGGSYAEARNAAELDQFFRDQAQALAQTFEAFVCESQNSSSVSLCDSEFTFRAQQRVQQEQSLHEYDSPEAAALDAIWTRIGELRDARDAALEQARVRSEELNAQYMELPGAMNDALSSQT